VHVGGLRMRSVPAKRVQVGQASRERTNVSAQSSRKAMTRLASWTRELTDSLRKAEVR
jgi:hypothetical protein